MVAPRRVFWRPTTINGLSAQLADDLVLQHDDGHAVWATRGFAVYRSRDGSEFERVFSVRPRLGTAWAGYLASVRSRSGYQELVELWPLTEERFVVFAGGDVHLVDLRTGTTERTHRMRYFGRRKGRGLMALGLTGDADGAIYYGEYTTEPGAHAIGVWKSSDEGRTWRAAFEFPAGTVRHIHTVQCDPYDDAIWLGTGDRNEECYVGVSHDGASTFEWIAQGTQQARTCGFAFFTDQVLWGMDTGSEPNRVMRLQRGRAAIEPCAELPGVTLYHRKLDESRALLGLGQQVAELWVANAGGDACRWLSWSLPRSPRGPLPAVRLGRGGPQTGGEGFIHVNPIRTVEHEAAILRIPAGAAPHPPRHE